MVMGLIIFSYVVLEMGCSSLNDDLYNNFLLDSPGCMCGFVFENVDHFFLR